jgi:hypothetical protein
MTSMKGEELAHTEAQHDLPPGLEGEDEMELALEIGELVLFHEYLDSTDTSFMVWKSYHKRIELTLYKFKLFCCKMDYHRNTVFRDVVPKGRCLLSRTYIGGPARIGSVISLAGRVKCPLEVVGESAIVG